MKRGLFTRSAAQGGPDLRALSATGDASCHPAEQRKWPRKLKISLHTSERTRGEATPAVT